MEQQADQECDYNGVVETLLCMFGSVISKDVIIAVVESCDGDLNLAAEAVMNMAADSPINDSTPSEESKSQTKQILNPDSVSWQGTRNSSTAPVPSSLSQTQLPPQLFAQPSSSYVSAAFATGAVPKPRPTNGPKPRPPPANSLVWTDQLRQIVTYHNQGSRILILMRGVPGSGKSYLAKQIIEITIGVTYSDFKTHIFSTDDYFMVRGQYQYDRFKLSEAHDWNQKRVRVALRRGLSPIIVDNTNIEIWEMEPYAREGVRNGYILEVVEPNTPWARNVRQLLNKNSHNVPAQTIKRMLDNYQNGITGAFLIKHYGLLYPAHMEPPVLRTVPICEPQQTTFQPKAIAALELIDPKEESENIVEIQLPDSQPPPELEEKKLETESDDEGIARERRFIEIQKQLEEMEKVEQEWENSEGWGDDPQETASTSNDDPSHVEPMPQRQTLSEESTPRDNLLGNAKNCEDWSQIAMFMPSWVEKSNTQDNQILEIPVRVTTSTSTCMEIGDTDINNPKKVLKVISATPRDINLFHIALKEKIPQQRMLDKSTMTNEVLLTENYRCKNEEQHFLAFKKLFKNIPKASLRDVFDKCCGDVNWAVDIILEGIADNQLEIDNTEDLSDDGEELLEQCNCLATYNVVPDTEIALVSSSPTSSPALEQNNIPIIEESVVLSQKKGKLTPSDSNLQLKRDIEKNFNIGDEHYSEHVLKIIRFRHGDSSSQNSPKKVATEITEHVPCENFDNLPSTSNDIVENSKETKDTEVFHSDDEESVISSLDEDEKTVNINLGREFVSQLDDLFGRRGMMYPENIMTRINIPVSLLNEINAFWMESLMCQLDEHDKQDAKMVKEDEEFAKQLAMKEAELARQGKEPEVPDFKEIMDMDFAISLYQKDVAEWRSKEPHDLAAKLTRDKLYNLFPDMTPDILSELLMAHDNNFQLTVEVLLMSTGKAAILQEKNGINKFVMSKEIERQEKLLEEEKKTLSEVEWPLLPKGETVNLDVVNGYRETAEQHLARRNLNYQKAQEYIRRGMTQVANYYSDLASFHKQKYEQANSLAAASLMQVHALNNPDNATIDLHYLRVGEAKESLDLFLDTHIQKLKESSKKSVRHHTLFFITGRGLHSNGGPRVKPAVKKRLRERGLAFSERNPGLLTAKVSADDKLSYQVP